MTENKNQQELDYNELKKLNFAELNKLILRELTETATQSAITKKYPKEVVIKLLQNPEKNEKELRNVSNYLYNTSANYKRLVLYFANMLKFEYIVKPYGLSIEKVNRKKFQAQYQKIIDLLDTMNIPHEFSKIMKIGFKEDVFYGYEHMTGDSYFIQRINPDYCQITSIEDGVYNYSFDFSYFDANKKKLHTYPKEFQDRYKLYTANKKNLKWQELDSKRTICIKVNEEVEYNIPPFNAVFEAVYDIEDYKELKKNKTKMDNYMVLTQKIPLDDKKGEPNNFLIDLDYATKFHNLASQSLPDSVGLITSPMAIEGIKLEKRSTEKDTVAEAERGYYNAAGVSQFLFNADKSSSIGLAKSIVTDEQIVFSVLRQLERWLNRKIKNFTTNYKFKVKFLDITFFNEDEVFNKYKDAATLGLPTKIALGASLGLSPSDMSSLTYLENDILNLNETLVPLQSSHTQSGKSNEGGAPVKSDNDITESGQKTRDNEGNVRD
ncbi:hypothetical protein WKH56_20800 [Priestia sp. SB1]|uniref:hypothetical protein n=1 Tax=Priestia sp. SB1 TaxID=3132359 RepID=UPI00318125BF